MGFDSKFEAKVAGALPGTFTNHGKKLSYVPPAKTYEVDFIDETNRIVIESKGWFRPGERTKMRLVKQQNPEYTYRLILQNPDLKINKTSKTSYQDWAFKHGFEVYTIRGGILIKIEKETNENR